VVENLIVGLACLLLGGAGGTASRWITARGTEDERANIAIVRLSAGVEHIATELTAIRGTCDLIAVSCLVALGQQSSVLLS